MRYVVLDKEPTYQANSPEEAAKMHVLGVGMELESNKVLLVCEVGAMCSVVVATHVEARASE